MAEHERVFTAEMAKELLPHYQALPPGCGVKGTFRALQAIASGVAVVVSRDEWERWRDALQRISGHHGKTDACNAARFAAREALNPEPT